MNSPDTRAAGFLAEKGIKQNDRVILFSHNMPEWGLTYFGILKTGATAIPIDPASSIDDILNFARAGEASAIYSLSYYLGSSVLGWAAGLVFSAAGWSATAATLLAFVGGAAIIAVLSLRMGGART